MTITHILNGRASIGWTSYSHTGVPVPAYATGHFVTVRFLSGPHKGHELQLNNMLTGRMEVDALCEEGAVVLVEYDVVDGKPAHGLARGHYRLRLTEPFCATVFIASSGAVMDLAMDVAAAMDEIKRQQPGIGTLEHIRSGLRVGQAVVGTMTTTLLLAYSGSHAAVLMLFMTKGLPLINMVNAPFIAAEVLNTLVGSFGLVTVAPFTAVAAGLLYRGGARDARTKG